VHTLSGVRQSNRSTVECGVREHGDSEPECLQQLQRRVAVAFSAVADCSAALFHLPERWVLLHWNGHADVFYWQVRH
jgi:hypothetical protein